MSDVIISVENLGKRYRIQHQAERQRYVALRDVIAEKAKGLFKMLKSENLKSGNNVSVSASSPNVSISESQRVSVSAAPPAQEDFWALKDVSFEVKRGEVVGIIGRNGAGKSTLLKILSRITEPTEGRVRIRGRVASLLEVGTGFHPELTGRENIFLNGAILGMHRAEIKRKFDEIVAFAEVEKFLDTPVKRYSSGMYVRLAFAVAAHLEPEILIVDEVLAVGDAEFQKKCLGKMEEVSRQEGRTVLFVSHNMSAVMSLCASGILLENGKVTLRDSIRETVSKYLMKTERKSSFRRTGAVQRESGGVGVEDFCISPESPSTGERVDFVFDLHRPGEASSPLSVEIAVAILTEDAGKVMQVYSKHMGVLISVPSGRSRIKAVLKQLPLAPGDYRVNVWVGCGDTALDWAQDCYQFTVKPGAFVPGIYVEKRGYPVLMPCEWETFSETPTDLGTSSRKSAS